jgi:hypothetical protein
LKRRGATLSLRGQSSFAVGAANVPRVLVCIEGAEQVEHGGTTYCCCKGRRMAPAIGGRGVCLSAPQPGELVGNWDS